MLVLMIGLTDSVHLAFEIRQGRARGESPQLSCLAIFSALLADLILLPAMLACFVRHPEPTEQEAIYQETTADG